MASKTFIVSATWSAQDQEGASLTLHHTQQAQVVPGLLRSQRTATV
ncbi:hypothetical protein PXO_00372 [Xanthomonas oryzae pv. oryzae PXO99A]|uniref:Uncharacterized protein n=1 Tax=Xanthomonas oryzae pv. oryzae (strain PXO99A) TaxID=360094 RepID=A0A0K0GJV2_XANOP|nr:hypothetical protein PXO_00372 [Xanthomonas oryzae pv. oryzae PXO99A]